MLFAIKKLTKVYGNRTVLNLPDLVFEKEIIYALQGPNGSGKTTLLEIMSLLLPPSTGTILYNNKKIDFGNTDLTPLRREIVMVQQNPVLFTTTVYKNLEFGLKIRGIPRMERQKIVQESLDLVGMREFSNAQAHRLSGGETQRVAIARALACSPRVMFFDEPTSNVDVENQIVIERIIQDINVQKKISVIFTTHNLTQASRLSHDVISLFDGRQVHSTYENIFAGRIVEDQAGRRLCLIRDEIGLSLDTEKAGPVRLTIDPLKVTLLRPQEAEGKENIFDGRLTQLSEEQGLVRAVVNIGIPLYVLLPKQSLKERGLTVGDPVKVLCPPEAIHVF
jgi:tungstate transport system ATP-binding protein